MGTTGLTPAEVIAQDEVLQEALGLPTDFKFGFRVTVYNWRMRKLRQLLGLTQDELGRLVGVGMSRISKIERFLEFPNKPIAEKIAAALRTTRGDLFPEWLGFYVLDKSTREFVSTSMEVRRAIGRAPMEALKSGWDDQDSGDPVIEAEVTARDSAVAEIVNSLEPRQLQVLTLRFGLDGGGSRTLEEVGEIIHRHKERVRQIEAKALRNLRRHTTSRKVMDYL